MTEIFIESMTCEQHMFLEKINVEIEEAKYLLLESMSPSPFFEANSEGETQSTGIFQAIKRLLQAILKAIGDGFKKIGSWVTGAKVTPEGQRARIQGMDPNAVVKLVDGDIADATDALKKAASGQMTIEDAKAFIDKKEAFWKTLKQSAIPVVGLAAFFMGKKFTVDRWKAQCQGAMDELEAQNRADNPNDSDSKIASKVAHLKGNQAKSEASKDAAQMIVNYMNSSTRRGLDMLMSPIRTAFQEGYIQKQIMDQANMMGTKEGRKKLAAQDKQKLKATKDYTKSEQTKMKNINKSSNAGNKALDKQAKAEDKLHKVQSGFYDNVK